MAPKIAKIRPKIGKMRPRIRLRMVKMDPKMAKKGRNMAQIRIFRDFTIVQCFEKYPKCTGRCWRCPRRRDMFLDKGY